MTRTAGCRCEIEFNRTMLDAALRFLSYSSHAGLAACPR